MWIRCLTCELEPEHHPCGQARRRVSYGMLGPRHGPCLLLTSLTESIRMTSQVRRRFVHCRLVAGVLLAGCGWFMPSTSWAGCSHYVVPKTDAESSERLYRLVAAETFPGDSWRSAPLDQRSPSPCSGFRCSRDSSSPLPVLQELPRIDVWGCLAVIPLPMRPNSSEFHLEDDSPHSVDRVERLPRPPR